MNAFADYIRRGDDAIRYYIGPHAYNALTGALDAFSPVQDYQSALEGSAALVEGVRGRNVSNALTGAAALGAGLGAVFMPGNQRPVMAAADGGITAYHGSPHDFDRFDSSKIGTGEGAQAYGHGLYFAENEGVAQAYRQALQRVDLGPFDEIGIPPRQWNAARMFAQNMDVTQPEVAARDFAQWVDREVTPDLVEAFKRAKRPGHTYQVRIDADPEDFLDWDKPWADQPENIQRAIWDQWKGMGGTVDGRELPPFTARSDAGIQEIIGAMNTSMGKQGAAEAALREKGIPGIRYLDAGSRGAGDGSRNYVVFDDKLITILKKYGLVPAAVTAGAALNAEDVQAAVEASWGDMNQSDRRAYLEAQYMTPGTAE